MAVLTAGAAALAAAGCSGGSGGSGDASGPTYNDAMEAMHSQALGAMKATVGQAELEENGAGHEACGGPDVLDSKDDSKRRASAFIRYPGDPADKRSSAELVKGMVEQLGKLGWTVDRTDPPSDNPDLEVAARLTKPGSGVAGIHATSVRLSGGDTVHELVTSLTTNCLRNPDWRKP